jgi:hypothetical protein
MKYTFIKNNCKVQIELDNLREQIKITVSQNIGNLIVQKRRVLDFLMFKISANMEKSLDFHIADLIREVQKKTILVH